MPHVDDYMREAAAICGTLQQSAIELIVSELVALRTREGRLYIVGLGGSLANAIHMAADLRKLCLIDAEAFDNIAELSARANDEGLETVFAEWLARAGKRDALMVLSVGGGTMTVSKCILLAVHQAKRVGCKVLGIVGPVGGDTYAKGDVVLRVPAENSKHITPHTEAFQMVITHCMVSHPLLQRRATKW